MTFNTAAIGPVRLTGQAAKISVCHNRRISRHKTFKTIAQRGKTSVDWFFGFKLHLLFNDQGEVVWLLLTPGNVDDRVGLTNMLEQDECNIFGKIFAARPGSSVHVKTSLH